MKERPILFSAPMVRAILNGSKTQTRRVCKNKVYGNGFHFDGRELLCHNDYLPPSALLMDYRSGGHNFTTSNLEGWGDACPYGEPGDRLWVRETWAHGIHALAAMRDEDGPFVYAATDSVQQLLGDRWRPSIHMPRTASRITLEITGVRVERLREISEVDALSEGIVPTPDGFGLPDGEHFHATDPRRSYLSLWEAINGPGSVEANPWVWVVEFKRVQGGAA